MDKIRFSIIIPHYNTPNLLSRCLASIPSRDDIQVIIVDDCSDVEVLLDVQIKNLKIIYNKKRGGAGLSRNIGLKYAIGDWLIFCDADDYFFTEIFNLKLDKYVNSDYDIVYLNVDSRYSDTGAVAFRHRRINLLFDCVAKGKDFNSVDNLKYQYLEPFGKFVKKDVLKKNEIYFEEVLYSNDTIFSIKIAYHVKSVCVDDEKVYCVNVERNSLTNVITREAMWERINVFIRANRLMDKYGVTGHKLSFIQYIVMARYFGVSEVFRVLTYLIYKKQNIFNGVFDVAKKVFYRFDPEYVYHSKMMKKYQN